MRYNLLQHNSRNSTTLSFKIHLSINNHITHESHTPIKDRKEVKREKKQFSVNERERIESLQSQIATQNHSWLAISHPTWTKRKRPKHPASSQKTLPSRKSYWFVIVCLIFDSIGSRVQNRVMVQLWFGNRIKHLPVWVLYTMSDLFSA